jgi:hypothetical protein
LNLPVGGNKLSDRSRGEIAGVDSNRDGDTPWRAARRSVLGPSGGGEAAELVGKFNIKATTPAQRSCLADVVVGRKQNRRAAGNLNVSVSGGKFATTRSGEVVGTGRKGGSLIEVEAKAAELPCALGIIGFELSAPSLRVDQRAGAALNCLRQGRFQVCGTANRRCDGTDWALGLNGPSKGRRRPADPLHQWARIGTCEFRHALILIARADAIGSQ